MTSELEQDYIPTGTTEERWAKVQEEEEEQNQGQEDQAQPGISADNDQEIEEYAADVIKKMEQLDLGVIESKKQIIKDFAEFLESKGIRPEEICTEIVGQLKGIVAEAWVRRCLPDKYKNKNQAERASKRKIPKDTEENPEENPAILVSPKKPDLSESKPKILVDCHGRQTTETETSYNAVISPVTSQKTYAQGQSGSGSNGGSGVNGATCSLGSTGTGGSGGGSSPATCNATPNGCETSSGPGSGGATCVTTLVGHGNSGQGGSGSGSRSSNGGTTGLGGSGSGGIQHAAESTGSGGPGNHALSEFPGTGSGGPSNGVTSVSSGSGSGGPSSGPGGAP